MGLTKASTGVGAQDTFSKEIKKADITVALMGNPNVGKSTLFNHITGMHQHTGNWPGKTVTGAVGSCTYNEKNIAFVDLPGCYSLFSHSPEEEVACDFIKNENPDVTVVVCDATCLERNLILVLQTLTLTANVIVCVNLIDEAKKKGICIDEEKLSGELNVPVIKTSARSGKGVNKLLGVIVENEFQREKSQVTDIEKIVELAESITKASITLKMTTI